MQRSDVIVLGAGAIGAGVAWRCAQRGRAVTVVDPCPGQGAWRTAAGMLAPVTELHYTETGLLRLGLASVARFADVADELAEDTGVDIGYRASGTVVAAWDGSDLQSLRDLEKFARDIDVDAEVVSGRELRAIEPALAAGVPGGLVAPGDHQVDPRRLHAALLAACAGRGVELVEAEGEIVVEHDRVTGVRLPDGTLHAADTVVVAAGSWSGQVAGLPSSCVAPVRPVKGQTLRLSLPPDSAPRRIVRARVQGSPVYAVPRLDGEVVVGASTEESGFDQSPRAGAVYELLRDAQTILPELGEGTLLEVSTGLRPGSPDNAPLVGPTPVAGLVLATGHYRNGISLMPVTADGVADLVTTGHLPDELKAFAPSRFDKEQR